MNELISRLSINLESRPSMFCINPMKAFGIGLYTSIKFVLAAMGL